MVKFKKSLKKWKLIASKYKSILVKKKIDENKSINQF